MAVDAADLDAFFGGVHLKEWHDELADWRYGAGELISYTRKGAAAPEHPSIRAHYMRFAHRHRDGTDDRDRNANVVESRELWQLRRSQVIVTREGDVITRLSDGAIFKVEDIDETHTTEHDITVITKRRQV